MIRSVVRCRAGAHARGLAVGDGEEGLPPRDVEGPDAEVEPGQDVGEGRPGRANPNKSIRRLPH